MSHQQHQQHQQPHTTEVSTRKKRRGMIEKRRRDKINNSLCELRRLVPAAFEKQGSAKLEKAEILQMTVDYLRMLHARGLADSLTHTVVKHHDSVSPPSIQADQPAAHQVTGQQQPVQATSPNQLQQHQQQQHLNTAHQHLQQTPHLHQLTQVQHHHHQQQQQQTSNQQLNPTPQATPPQQQQQQHQQQSSDPASAAQLTTPVALHSSEHQPTHHQLQPLNNSYDHAHHHHPFYNQHHHHHHHHPGYNQHHHMAAAVSAAEHANAAAAYHHHLSNPLANAVAVAGTQLGEEIQLPKWMCGDRYF